MTKPKLKFERLARYRSKLDACIRCGYCYEHCPLYKSTGWESDAPRAKLIMLFGLLNGQLEPTPEVGEKLFSCFHCKRCEAVCSSGIPFTDILAAAREDLQEAGLDVEGITSYNEDGACSKCLICVRACKHEARFWDGNKIAVDRAKCQGCGACVEACPRLGIQLRQTFGTGEQELLAKIDEYLAGAPADEVRTIVFCCNWSNYPGILNSRIAAERQTKEYLILVNMCAGRLQERLILETFTRNAWGVLVTGCPDDECEHQGSQAARGRVHRLQGVLDDLSLDSRRLAYAEVPRGNPAQLTTEVDAFLEVVRTLAPPFPKAR